ncbi:MAG: hypothetical protein HGA22_14400, partial [Clostridiales bacterium]|nr:hypothetical protein [Clostridiales bacterium]
PFDTKCANFFNQNEFFCQPLAPELNQRLVATLTPYAMETYQWFYWPYIKALPEPLNSGPSQHCTHLLPFFESQQITDPLVFPFCGNAAHINTFYVGKGWLENDNTFRLVRQMLARCALEVRIGDIAELDQVEGTCPGIYTSNIYSSDEKYSGFKNFIHKFGWFIGYDDATNWEVQYYSSGREEMVPCSKVLGSEIPDPHKSCCMAIDHVIDLHANHFLEVIEPHPTEGMDYGFRFYKGQQRIAVNDFLKQPCKENIIAVHILLGSGVSPAEWYRVCAKATREARKQVLIFEHRRECTDWQNREAEWDVHAENLLPHAQLDRAVFSLDYRWKKFGCANAKGQVNDVRNLFYFLDKTSMGTVGEHKDSSAYRGGVVAQATSTHFSSHCCAFLNTYYQTFLNEHYCRMQYLSKSTYADQKKALLDTLFGDSDFYSKGIIKSGSWRAEDFIINCRQLQNVWAHENDFVGSNHEVIVQQIKQFQTNVIYIQDLSTATKDFIELLRPHAELIVGQIASPLPDQAYIKGFDILISSFPHFVDKFRSAGVTAYYLPLAFEPRILSNISVIEFHRRPIECSFIGGISP